MDIIRLCFIVAVIFCIALPMVDCSPATVAETILRPSALLLDPAPLVHDASTSFSSLAISTFSLSQSDSDSTSLSAAIPSVRLVMPVYSRKARNPPRLPNLMTPCVINCHITGRPGEGGQSLAKGSTDAMPAPI